MGSCERCGLIVNPEHLWFIRTRPPENDSGEYSWALCPRCFGQLEGWMKYGGADEI